MKENAQRLQKTRITEIRQTTLHRCHQEYLRLKANQGTHTESPSHDIKAAGPIRLGRLPGSGSARHGLAPD